ncbi:MAG: alpha-1,2-fucosyltransferase [Chitinophagaceae bacterium]|nr:MAG: alpha-1,2-fucosyltransferase [Chitinophagaceae bacterium]
MVISQLNGGMGNQMFQYAAAKSLSLHHQVPLFIDDSKFKRDTISELEVDRKTEIFNFPAIRDSIAHPATLEMFSGKRKLLTKLLPRHRQIVYREPFYHFDKNFFHSRKTVYLQGAWQSYRYFEKYRTGITPLFRLDPEYTSSVEYKADEILAANSVSVHVRRNDYLRMQIILEWHGIMSKEYYVAGLEELTRQVGALHVYYFTDDPQWVSENLMPLYPGQLISSEVSANHYQDFYLMSRCHHNIIANSSFSWWAAYLNEFPGKKVIAPKRWFDQGPKDTQDLIPPAWQRM